MGAQITRLALPFQVYALTGSTLAIAALTTVQLIPVLAFSLMAGSLADTIDRRRLLLVTQLGLMVCSVALVVLAGMGDPPLVALFAVAFIAAGLSAVDQPTRSSSIARLVPPARLPAALALNQLNNRAASIVGPALAGVLIAAVGLVGAYLVDVLSFMATLVAVLALRPLPPLGVIGRPGLTAIREGLAFVRSRRAILGSFVIDLNAMVLAMPTSLYPAIALDVFRVGPVGLGLLASAPAVGAFLAAVFSGWVGRVVRVGRAVIGCVLVWGVALTAFGLATVAQEFSLVAPTALFAVALVALAVAGAADMASAVFRSTIVQLEAPDSLRGRVMSIHTLVVTSGPRIGDIQAAVVASIIGPGQAVVAGGLACVAGVGLVTRAIPELAAHVVGRDAPVDLD